MSIFKPCQNKFRPLVNDNEDGPSGGAQRKIDNIFLERKDDILLSLNRFLTVSLLSEIFT